MKLLRSEVPSSSFVKDAIFSPTLVFAVCSVANYLFLERLLITFARLIIRDG